MVLIAIGFFGCEEVAEILGCPFGTDDNDIDLKFYGKWLLKDLEVIWKARDDRDLFLKGGVNYDDSVDFVDMMHTMGYTKTRGPAAGFFSSGVKVQRVGRNKSEKSCDSKPENQVSQSTISDKGSGAEKSQPQLDVVLAAQESGAEKSQSQLDVVPAAQESGAEKSQSQLAEAGNLVTVESYPMLPGAVVGAS